MSLVMAAKNGFTLSRFTISEIQQTQRWHAGKPVSETAFRFTTSFQRHMYRLLEGGTGKGGGVGMAVCKRGKIWWY
jgi:hypothetical protein